MSAAVLIANEAAGSSDDPRGAAALSMLRDRLTVHDVRVDAPDRLAPALSSHVGDLVIVAGGDGTLHAALNALHRLGRLDDVRVGLIPLGTGNDFARAAGVPLDPREAARRSVEGRPTPVDVLTTDEGELVVNAAHVGVGAVAADRAEPAKPLLGPLAYPVGALLAGVEATGWHTEVTLDDRVVHDDTALLVWVGNGPAIGGGTAMCPVADPTDGLLDVVVAGPVARTDRPALAIALREGTHLERDDVHHWTGRRVTIAGDPLPHDRDGELGDARARATYTIRRSAWRLLR